MKNIFVAMSGGVDSSVAAALLVEKGYNVSGITMKLFEGEDTFVEDAKKVSKNLGIPHYTVDLTKEFEENVINYFLEEYICGRTPNPCVACNKHIKFGLLIDEALKRGADSIATGHYARIEYDNNLNRFLLKKSKNTAKDQSYVLYNLTQHMLSHALLPVENFEKSEVRQMAVDLGFELADKPESQEICFIKDNDYVKYIRDKTKIKPKEGYFIDEKGNKLGKHKGIINYTIGQRKGLGIAFGKPMFVVSINSVDNTITLGESGAEFSKDLIASNINFIPFDNLQEKTKIKAKIRYSAKEAPATVMPLEANKIKVEFDNKQRAITPGQSIVFYDGDLVIGGGVIDKVIG